MFGLPVWHYDELMLPIRLVAGRQDEVRASVVQGEERYVLDRCIAGRVTAVALWNAWGLAPVGVSGLALLPLLLLLWWW